MTILSLIACLTSFILLVIFTGFRPLPPAISKYELKRRLKLGEPQAIEYQQQIETINQVASLVRLIKAILTVLFIYFSVESYGWLVGGLMAVAGLTGLEIIARVKFVRRASRSLDKWLEQHLFNLAHLYGKYFKFLAGFEAWTLTNPKFGSRQELNYQISCSPFLSPQEQAHLQAALELESAAVESIMTPIKDQPTVSQNDLMGPLLLHELHQTGEDIFPVTDSSTGSKIVGVIAISHLLSLDDKTSHKVKYYMNANFPGFELEASIEQCLNQLIETKTFMGVVYDADGRAQGVVTLDACLQLILGKVK